MDHPDPPVWERVARTLVRRRKACGVLAALLTLAALPGALRLRFHDDVGALLPDDDPAAQRFRRAIASGLLTDSLWVLIEKESDSTSTDLLIRFGEGLALRLSASPAVKDVRLSAIPELESFDAFAQNHAPLYLDDAGFDAFRERLSPESMEKSLRNLRRRLESGPPAPAGALAEDPLGLRALLRKRFRETNTGLAVAPDPRYMLSRDGRSMLVEVVGHRPARDTEYSREILRTARKAELKTWDKMVVYSEAVPGMFTVSCAGGYAVAAESERVIRLDLEWTLVTSVPIVLALFWLAFRRGESLWAAALTLALALTWTGGLAGWTGGPYSPLTATLAAMLAGLAIDFPIHLVHAYDRFRAAGHGPDEAAERAVERTGAPMAVSVVTTATAFLALLASSLPGLRELGMLAAAGLLSGWLAALLAVPALIVLSDRERVLHDAPRALDRALERLASLAVRRRGAILALSAIASLAAGAVLLGGPSPGIPFETDPDRLRPAGDPVLETQRRIQSAFGTHAEPFMLLYVGNTTEAALSNAGVAETSLAAGTRDGWLAAVDGPSIWLPPADRQDRRLAALSSIDRDRAAADVEEAAVRAGFREGAFAGHAEWLRRALAPERATFERLPADVQAHLRRRYLGPAGDGGPPFALVYAVPKERPARAEDRALLLDRVRSVLGADAPLTGMLMVNESLERFSKSDELRLMGWAAAAVLACVALHARSAWGVLLTLTPVAAGMLWSAGLMKAFDMRLNPANLIVFAWLAGIGVDNGVHLVRQAVHRGAGAEKALRDTGRALLLAGLTTIGGFGSLAFADHPLVRSVGVVLSLGVACALAASLLTLPAMLAMRPMATFPRPPGIRPSRPDVLLRHPLNTIGWLRFIELLTVLLPRRFCLLLSDAITTAVYVGGRRLRETLSRSASIVRGGDPRSPACRRLGLRMLRNHGHVIVDYMLIARSPRRALNLLMPERPPEAHRPLRDALDGGRGAVLVSIHLGHWELGGAYLTSLGYPLRVVTAASRLDPVERHRTETRARSGIPTTNMAGAGTDDLELLEVLHALRRNEAVVLLADRPGSKLTVEVPYLGRPTAFPAGPALLAWLTGAPIVPSVLVRRPDGTYAGTLLAPIAADPAAERGAEIRRLTAAIAAAFEPWVRAHPEQWYNFIAHGA